MNESIKGKVEQICQDFRRPFKKKDFVQFFKFLYPKEEINSNTLGKYLSYCVDKGLINISKWSEGSNNYYISNKSETKEVVIMPLLSPYSEENNQVFYALINPLDLIEISHIYRYLEFDDSDSKNKIQNWYYKITYPEAESSYQYIGSKTVIIQAFLSDIKNLIKIDTMLKEIPQINLHMITIPYLTNMERKIFCTLKGEEVIEMYRKIILILKYKYNWDDDRIKQRFSKLNQSITIIINDIDDLDERREELYQKLNILHKPDSKEKIKFIRNMTDVFDFRIKEIKLKKLPEKREKIENIENIIKEKEENIKKIKQEIKILGSEKKNILNEI